jgi:predicted alpha/beta superfamily hydrolase
MPVTDGGRKSGECIFSPMYFCLLQVVAFSVASERLGESRTINVYTPPAYATASAALPVLYMLDGGMAEDFPHVSATLDSLIALKRVRPVILVGIENTERRRDLTGPTSVAKDSTIARQVGGSAAFRSFIRDELMPEVKRRYRTTSETAIVGESLAGLFVVETLLLEPTLFRGYIALSPSLWWNGGSLVRSAPELVGALGGLDRVVFLASANEEQIVEPTARLAAILMRLGQGSVLLTYKPRPDLAHDTIFRALAPEAFIDILGEGATGHD